MITWEILIATLCDRAELLGTLLAALLPQVDAARGAVRVTAYQNQGERPLADIRQALVESADAQYVSFIDDDDMVPDDFVSTILPLLDGVDTVGWRMQYYVDGVPAKPTFHSLRYGGWWEDETGWYRDVSHLNPVRLALARRCDFRVELPEDWGWVQQMQKLVTTEHCTDDDKIMYHYRHSTSEGSKWVPGSVSQSPGRYPPRPPVSSSNLVYHPRSTC